MPTEQAKHQQGLAQQSKLHAPLFRVAIINQLVLRGN